MTLAGGAGAVKGEIHHTWEGKRTMRPTGEARLVRTIRFRAMHHYRRAAWTEAENRAVFGAQTDPHAHDWRVEVHAVGPVDPVTGWCVDLGALDAALAALTRGWDGGDLNAAVPEVAEGRMMPSTENLARWLHARLGEALGGPDAAEATAGPAPRIVEVRVFESDDLGSVWPG